MQGSARKDVVCGAARVYTFTVPGPKWKSWLNRDHYYYWPGRESTGDTFKNNTPHHPLSISILPGQEREEASSSPLDSVISHYGRERLPSPEGWGSHSYEDLSWEVSILKEFGNEVFLLGPCTVQEGSAHFHLGSDSLLCFGSRADALSHEQQCARSSARWAKIWWLFRVFSGWPTGSRLLHPADPTSPAVTSEPKRRPRNPQIPYTPVRRGQLVKGIRH